MRPCLPETTHIREPSPSLAGRRVSRMNGAGNKILVLDLRGGSAATPDEARAIHRAPGLDYDQMMVLSNPAARYARLCQHLHNDGNLAGACGNGTRCVADRSRGRPGRIRWS